MNYVLSILILIRYTTVRMASWKCDICGVELSLSSQFNHLKSLGHKARLLSFQSNSCKICKVKVTTSHISRHSRSRAHIAALSIVEEQQKKATLLLISMNDEIKARYSALDAFIVTDCTRYIQWACENPQKVSIHQSPRSVVYTVINNLYSAISCKDLTCAWWPSGFELPQGADTWCENLLYRAISDIAMAESILIAAKSELTFVSK